MNPIALKFQRLGGAYAEAALEIIRLEDLLELKALEIKALRAHNTVDKFKVGPFTIDRMTNFISVEGQHVRFTHKEFLFMELLLVRSGRVVTKGAFMDYIYGEKDEPDQKIVDVFLCKVRQKLKPFGVEGLIQTIWGRGYMIEESK